MGIIVKIEFYTDNEFSLHYKPEPIRKHTPEWYNNMPPDKLEMNARMFNILGDNLTIKSCMPVFDYMTSGYVILNHADILITPEEMDGQCDFSWFSKKNALFRHSHSQCPIDINNKKHNYIK